MKEENKINIYADWIESEIPERVSTIYTDAFF